MSKYSAMIRRIYVVLLLIFLGFLFVGYHLYQVQIVRHDELYAKAQEKYTAVAKKKGTRGEIFDWSGNLLVCNVPVCDIVCDPSIIGGEEICREAADFFGKATGEDPEQLYRRLMTKETKKTDKDGNTVVKPLLYAVIARGVELDLSKALQQECQKRKYRGIRFVDSYRRSYPKEEMLANILGVTSMEQDRFIPLMGLEKILNEKMQSGETQIKYERTRDGRIIRYGDVVAGDPVRDGFDVYLTVREPIQAIVEEELDKLMATIHPKGAFAVMIEPFTGDILAIAQRPSYNPNDRSALVKNPQAARSRIAEDYFEPGSVMKTFVVSAALDRKLVTADTIIDCTEGAWVYAKRTLHDSHPVRAVPVREVIKQSSNIGTAKISLMLGEKNLYETLRAFGFGQKTGIPLYNETSGALRPLKKWDSLSIARFCIGQGVAVSSLQMARAYCMIANGGYPVKLRLVDRLDRDGITEKYPYSRGKNIFRDPNTAKIMKNILKTVTEPGGTGVKAAVPGFHVAGKTGTAEQAFGGKYEDRYYASFCGFVPLETPRFVLYVVCEEPPADHNKPHTGGAVSAPVFSAIAERTLKYMREPAELSKEDWEAERAALWKKDRERRVREDERVRARRAAAAAGAAAGRK